MYGVGSLILIGIQPIIISSRPSEIDIYTFAMMTVIYEAIIFLPLMLLERKRIKSINNYHFNYIYRKEKYDKMTLFL